MAKKSNKKNPKVVVAVRNYVVLAMINSGKKCQTHNLSKKKIQKDLKKFYA